MNLSFIKLDINIMNDTKIKIIRKMPDGDSIIVLWIGLLCLGMKSGRPGIIEIGDGIPFTAETLSVELDIPINTVRLGLKTFVDFKMIELWENGETYITNFEKHQELTKIDAAKEKSRISSKKHREKLKLTGGDDHVTVTGMSRDGTDKEEDKKKKEIKTKIKNKMFIKPTLAEIQAYCYERNNTVNPESFLDHYESNGWQVGRNKMKDWKAAVRTWERNNYGNQKRGGPTLSHNREVCQRLMEDDTW